ncbi:MAG TPA: AAA family ATPase [Candidatus Dormibacteraeota bacterium]
MSRPVRASATPRLVGRAGEVAELEAELRRSSTGEVRCALVTADPGVGKTRLCAEVLVRNRRSTLGLRARALPLGGTASFALWAEALERHLAECDPDTVRELCGGVLADLTGLLRSVAAVHGDGPGREPPRLRLLAGLTTVLRNLARDAPVVVFLDDVHLADASSLDALSYLARNLAGSRVLVLAAARPAELAANAVASETLLGLEQDGIMRRLALTPLEREHVRTLVEVVLGQDVAPEALVEWLFERSRGNPLFAIGLLRSLIDEGADLDHPRLNRLPEEMSQRVRTRTRTLDGPALATLELLATFGRRVGLEELVHVGGRTLEELGSILEALLRQRLVIEEERDARISYEIAHPVIQETIYQDMAGARRRAMHAVVARALVQSGGLAAAAPHFVRSAAVGDREAISTVIEAFRQAEARESYHEALALLDALLALIPVGDARWLEVLDVMAPGAEWVVDHTGDTEAATGIEALRRIEAQLEGSPDLARRGLAKLRLGVFLAFSTGDAAAAARAGTQARELFESAGQRAQALVAVNELGWFAGIAGDHAAQAIAARSVLADAEELGDRVLTLQALASVAWTSWLLGNFADAEAAMRRSMALARAEGKLYRLTWSQSFLALSLALVGRLDEADALLREARIDNPAYADTTLLEIAVWCNWIAGRFPAAAEAWRESQSWTRGSTSSRRGWGIPVAAVSMVELGDREAARACLVRATETKPWQVTADLCTWASGCLAERPQDRVPRLLEAVDQMRAQGCLPLAAFASVDLAEAALDGADAGAARRATRALQEMTTRAGGSTLSTPELNHALFRGLAELALACERLAAAESEDAADLARRAAGRFGGLHTEAFHGRALHVLGRALAPRHPDEGRGALVAAIEVFTECGAEGRRERSLQALAALGQAGRRAASARAGLRELTPRQRDVVRLAVEGRTAREIGGRLHIGERTVETHLANAYVKLGVASRVDLVRRAQELGV